MLKGKNGSIIFYRRHEVETSAKIHPTILVQILVVFGFRMFY